MAHEYRHLLSAKRAGRGHDPAGGIEETQPGELAILCAACPHKGINTDIVDDDLFEESHLGTCAVSRRDSEL